MKIINRQDFMKLPENTLFSKYEPCVHGPLEIKGESLQFDFLVQQIADAIECNDSGEFVDKLTQSQEHGVDLKMDFDCPGRDGCFDKDQLFAIWQPWDVEALIERLKECLPDA